MSSYLNNVPLLSNLIQIPMDPLTIQQFVILIMLNKRQAIIQQQIQNGSILIFDRNSIKHQIDLIKSIRRQKEKELGTFTVMNSPQLTLKFRAEIKSLKKQQGALRKEWQGMLKNENIQKVKRWGQQQQEVREKHLRKEQVQRMQQNQEKQRNMQEQARKQMRIKQQKQRQIKENLQKMQQKRLERQEIIRSAQVEYSKLRPRFLQIQKKFRQMQQEVKFQQQVFKKSHKINTQMDHQAIKLHQQVCIDRLRQRSQDMPPPQTHGSRFNPQDQKFKIFIDKDESKTKEQLEKVKRRMQYQSKVKTIPLRINKQIKLKSQIAIDKGKNPLKYNFLKQKDLGDQQIYAQFKNFKIDVDRKELGNQYLLELPSINQKFRMTKSQSESSLSRNVSQRVKYKDYLTQLKQKRGSQMFSQKQKQDRTKLLQNQLRLKQQNVQGYKYNNIQTVLQKEKQLQQLYMKTIQAKLLFIQKN